MTKKHLEDKGKSASLDGIKLEIYQHYLKTGDPYRVIAEKFNVNKFYVQDAINRGLATR